MQTLTRRNLLSSTAAGAVALALGSTVSIASVTCDPANCARDHKVMGYRLGVYVADPAVSDTAKNHAIKTAGCPTCGTGIAPSGLAFGEHMWD